MISTDMNANTWSALDFSPAGSLSSADETAPESSSIPASTSGIQATLDWLLSPESSGSSPLAQLTGVDYSPSNPPDYLAVESGSDVTAQFAGGYSIVKWVNGSTNMTFFATGTPPNAAKGVAITYGAGASTQTRQQNVALATQYLSAHLSDSQNAAGQWNHPTFDVQA